LRLYISWRREHSRLNRVTVTGSRDATTIEIPWDSRQALLERLRREGEAEDIITASKRSVPRLP
jgi:hypothetical protein